MALHLISTSKLSPIREISFAEANINERADLQRLLRSQIEVISKEVLVVSEEFSDWEDSKRRIDLLGIDKTGCLVVIELKRTEDGGHMELQALRYAAMVSTLTADRLIEMFSAFRQKLQEPDDAESIILGFVGANDRTGILSGKVRIILVSAEFSKEVTTTVLWLNQFDGLDIRCVRLRPHELAGQVILDVQQVIPLPEAEDYQVRLKQKTQELVSGKESSSNRDYTRFNVTVCGQLFERLPKRRAILKVVEGLVTDGVEPDAVLQVLGVIHGWGPNVLRSAEGDLDREAFVSKILEAGETTERHIRERYFVADSELIHSGSRTLALTSQWGEQTAQAIHALIEAFPTHGVSVTQVES